MVYTGLDILAIGEHRRNIEGKWDYQAFNSFIRENVKIFGIRKILNNKYKNVNRKYFVHSNGLH